MSGDDDGAKRMRHNVFQLRNRTDEGERLPVRQGIGAEPIFRPMKQLEGS